MRKIVTDERCCHIMSGDMSQDRRHSFDLSGFFTFSPTSHSTIKTLSIGRMDNFKTYFGNGNSCANAYFLRYNAKTESNYILNSSPNVIETVTVRLY